MDIPQIITHRGASAYAPENTLAAFTKAHAMGAEAIECDVSLTADDQPIIIHDNFVDRTTNAQGAEQPVKITMLPQILLNLTSETDGVHIVVKDTGKHDNKKKTCIAGAKECLFRSPLRRGDTIKISATGTPPHGSTLFRSFTARYNGCV